MSKWIDARVAIPTSTSVRVLCWKEYYREPVVMRSDDSDWEYVTHWMPLPAPPEDSDE